MNDALYFFGYALILIVGISISIYLIARLWRTRKTAGMYFLLWAIVCVVIWSFTYILEIAFEDFTIKSIWVKLEYLGIPYLSFALFGFALVYSGRGNWLTRNRFIALAIVPTVSLLLALTNDLHHLLWSSVRMPIGLTIGPLTVGHGPWYTVNVGYSYVLLLLATFYFIQIAIRSHTLYRSHAIIMLIGLIIPWIGNIFYILSIGPIPSLDWTPLAFTLTIITLAIGFARFGLMDILPIAQSTIFNAMRDGVIVADTKGRIVEINPSAQTFFQQHNNNLIGQSLSKIMPDFNDQIQEKAQAVHTTQQEITLGDGSDQRIYNLRGSSILGQRGQVLGHMLVLTDISEQKQAQSQMLLQSTALKAAENGIVITDPSGKIEWANPAFTRLTGYEQDEVLGKNPNFLKSGQQPVIFYKTMWDTILAGKVWHGELVNRRKDGTLYFEEMIITPLTENEKITHFIAIKQDVTNRKQAEERLRQAHQEAVEINKMKTQLLANVSHDLRTPLGAIMGYAEMLQTDVFGKVNEEQKDAATEILDSANQLLTFVNNLIGQAQIETGRLLLKKGEFRPVELIDGIQATISYMAEKKGIALETEIDPNLPLQINGDGYWLKQIVLNLVNNAIKFTEVGSVKIYLYKFDSSHWAIQVKDTGIGIPNEAQEIIFEAFRQVDSSTTRQHGGSGLGLSIVKQLVALMGGKIELKSEINQGSTFTVILPFTNSEEQNNGK